MFGIKLEENGKTMYVTGFDLIDVFGTMDPHDAAGFPKFVAEAIARTYTGQGKLTIYSLEN